VNAASLICALLASPGHVGERACHFRPDALNGADADLARDLEDAFAATQLRLDALFDGGIDPRAAAVHPAHPLNLQKIVKGRFTAI
jgi:hypothetical protein